MNHNQLTLGSLFSGSGGFELAGKLCGIQPVWASEIDPFAVRVTTKHFPEVKHYGDINQINGATVLPVDIVTMGSPCTNLSVAGKREGLTGKESRLFFDAIRVIKEMRKETHDRPRYIVFENVPGLFSSSDREDFRQVLSEIVGIVEPGAEVPAPDKSGWPTADVLLGDGWSVAYRTFNAQHFGVPQRRKRIYLVADFAGERAAEILFEPEGVCRDFTQGSRAWQNPAGAAADGAGTAIEPRVYGITSNGSNAMKSGNPTSGIFETNVARTLDANGGCRGNGAQVILSPQSAYCLEGNAMRPSHKGSGVNREVAFVLNTVEHHAVCYAPNVINRDYFARRLLPLECAVLQGFPRWWCDALETPQPTEDEVDHWSEVFETHRRIVGTAKKPKSRAQIIKWLKNPRTDAAEYRLWGLGLALPCACFVLAGISSNC